MKAIEAKDQATIYLQAKGTNELTASEDAATAIQAEDSQISLSGSSNTISAGTKATFAGSDGHEFGNGLAIKALKDSHVTATASDKNQIFGAVYAEKGGSITLNGTFNGIYSNAVIKNAGGMEDSEDEGAQKVKFHTALYAEGADSSITLSGSANILHTYAERGENNRERAIWAYDGGDITINGYTSIATDDYTADTNSDYISIVAGTSVNLTEEDVLKELPANKIAKVEINYADYSGTEGSGKSVIQGDILAAYAGKVTIQPVEGDTTSGLDIKGNLLSANKGELNVNLGNGGTLTGRIDDYAEAGVVEDGHARIFNPAFSYKVYRGGHVNLTMGPNSIWKVTGQSWVTSIHTPDVSDDNLFGQDGQPYSGATIDLLAFDNNYKQNAHSLTIYDMQGDARFRLHLNGNRNMSDMLYIRHGSGHYLAIIPDMVTLQDMYATYEGGRYEGLRFATVGEGSDVTFTAVTLNGGVNNVVYEIGTDSYATSRENEQYNGATLSLSKPGDDTVDGLFASQPSAISNDLKDDDDTSLKHVTNFKLIGVRGQPVPDVPDDEEEEEDPEQPDVDDTPDHSGSADTPVPDTPESDITESDTPADDQHDYPVNSDDSGSSGSDEPSVTPAPDKTHNDNKGSTGGNSSHNTGTNSSSGNSSNAPDIYIPKISDSGKTIIDMSRANYANAVYMDTLNKRLGEARFYGQNDDGVWARIRYDNIGKENSFRSHNVMVEAGYDVKTLCDHGINLTGFALDYMHGDIDYRTVNGDGDLDRYGLWFHTTYLGNDGQYADLVLKYAHLETDFDFNNRYKDEKITGDYDNDIFSVSGEYGWKFASAEGWYIEPQGQLQYTYVTSADYTTSQDTKVSLDSIHSLIGRAGFRAGRDFLKAEYPCTVYLRADVLHEFAGDQKISAHDKTGPMDVTYKNDDTWYSAGLGLSMQSSENTYFFVEAEQIFGADNESSYTFTGGFSHRF